MNTLIEWAAPPSDFSIEKGTVHLWAWDFNCSKEELDHHMTLLSPEEHARLQRLRFDGDRFRYAVSHAVLRLVLGRYLGVEPTLVAFTRNKFGKPDLTATLATTSKLSFNLSHTNRIALLAIAADLKVGVDVEELRHVETEIVERHFSGRERRELADLTGEQWLEGFYNCWTRKEAILKAEGIGLNGNLDAFDVTLRPGDLVALLGFDDTSGLTLNWHLSGLRLGLSVVGALATSAVPTRVDYYNFSARSG